MIFGEQDILGFDIPVNYLVLLMDCINGFDDVADIIFEKTLFYNTVELSLLPQFAAFGVLHL